MTRRLRWTNRAVRRLEGIGDYIAQDNPTAAEQAVGRLRAVVEHLVSHPAMGRSGRITGTRELVLTGIPYIIAYRVTESTVDILTIMHTSQRWPERL
ncbi:MAG: type II toxin-antitoxin system RelE/ParE family toxin [Rhizobiales bacterium]|nr:type II toxin-antitoxin system RelE/ParE family toxin [Hyphomicrobiales bacterium]